MHTRRYALLLAAVLAFGSTACAQESTDGTTEAVTEATTEASAGTAQSAAKADATADRAAAQQEKGVATLSDKWTDYELQINDDILKFPMMLPEFEALGWEASDDLTETLEPNTYSMYRFKKGDKTCTAYILNLGMNTMPASDCLLAGLSIDNFDWKLDGADTITLPGGLIRGEATADDILAAYGTPSDTYEGDLYTKYTYETDYNSSVEMKVFKESGKLEDITVENFVAPDDFEAGEVNEEVPAELTAYQKPEALSDDLTAYEIELDGSVYSLPVPVITLLADGWEINPSETDEYVVARDSGWVGLIKGGQSFHTLAWNGADYATIPENCWIESLEVGGYDLELDGALPGGIRIGMSKDDFLAALQSGNMTYEEEESGDFIYYTYNENAYDQKCEVIVYTKADGQFPQNTVIEVSCRNRYE